MARAIRGLKGAVGGVYVELRFPVKAVEEFVHDVLCGTWKTGSVIDHVEWNSFLVQDWPSVPENLRSGRRAWGLLRVLPEGRLDGDAIFLLRGHDSNRERNCGCDYTNQSKFHL